MKILKGEGSFVILTPEAVLQDQLLNIERAGRTCYQSANKTIDLESAKRFACRILKLGHESVIEHSIMTVQFNNVSRGFTHELVRHRLTAISQQSTRYCDCVEEGGAPDLEGFGLKCVVPPHQDENVMIPLEDGSAMTPSDMFKQYEMFYRALRKHGWQPQDARQFLPIGIKSQIVFTANFREWRHIFFMRTAKTAHWEIRRVMCNLLEMVQGIVPVIFDDFVEAGVDRNGLRYFEKKQPES